MSKLENLHLPVRLDPVIIPKPWGREVWYTGIEERGVSRVIRHDGSVLPLSDYLDSNRQALCANQPVVLLKELDPNPEPVKGDLYFEVHQHKREVYVVVNVDRQAWPEGVGQIRFGMNQALRREYASDDKFRQAYLEAVQRYEATRRALDDQQQAQSETASGSQLHQLEATQRASMDSFSAVRELRVGDVVQVPTWLPHSLQHGVRVVEFQTPTYERFILSFAQKVLTQPNWDTAQALPDINLEPPPGEQIEQLAPGVERVAAFSDFAVWRVSLGEGSPNHLTLPGDLPYVLCMVIRGELQTGHLQLRAGQAAFIPHAGLQACALDTSARALCLLAAPGL